MDTTFRAKLLFTVLLAVSCSLGTVHSRGDETTRRPLRIGYLSQGTGAESEGFLNIFREQLSKLGYVEGKDITIKSRWAHGDVTLLPSLATQLVESKVDMIVTGGTPGTVAAKKATSSISIIAIRII